MSLKDVQVEDGKTASFKGGDSWRRTTGGSLGCEQLDAQLSKGPGVRCNQEPREGSSPFGQWLVSNVGSEQKHRVRFPFLLSPSLSFLLG